MSAIRARLAPVLIGLALAAGVTSFAAAEGGGTLGSHNPWAKSVYGGTVTQTQQSASQPAPSPPTSQPAPSPPK
jgi:hypothetical protein